MSVTPLSIPVSMGLPAQTPLVTSPACVSLDGRGDTARSTKTTAPQTPAPTEECVRMACQHSCAPAHRGRQVSYDHASKKRKFKV